MLLPNSRGGAATLACLAAMISGPSATLLNCLVWLYVALRGSGAILLVR